MPPFDGMTKQPWWRRPWVIVVLCVVALLLVSGTLRFTFSYSTNSSSPRDVAAAYTHGTGWKRVTATDGQFTASFPTSPTLLRAPSQVGGVTVHNVRYISHPTSDDTFGVLVVTFPREVKLAGSVQDFLNNTEKDEAKASKGTITETRSLRVQGYPAVDFVIDSGSSGMHELVVLTGHTQYAVAVIGSASALSAYTRFRDSFHLLHGA
jgi:hypothetical protein